MPRSIALFSFASIRGCYEVEMYELKPISKARVAGDRMSRSDKIFQPDSDQRKRKDLLLYI